MGKEREETTRNSTQHTHTHAHRGHNEPLYMQQFLMTSSLFPFAHLWQIPNVICVQQELLEAPRVPQNVLGNVGQRAVTLVHELHLSIASFEDWNALEHGRILSLFHYTTKLSSFFILHNFQFIHSVLAPLDIFLPLLHLFTYLSPSTLFAILIHADKMFLTVKLHRGNTQNFFSPLYLTIEAFEEKKKTEKRMINYERNITCCSIRSRALTEGKIYDECVKRENLNLNRRQSRIHSFDSIASDSALVGSRLIVATTIGGIGIERGKIENEKFASDSEARSLFSRFATLLRDFPVGIRNSTITHGLISHLRYLRTD
jgi:hypothetical protein